MVDIDIYWYSYLEAYGYDTVAKHKHKTIYKLLRDDWKDY